MPVYNEAATIVAAIDRVLDVDFPCPVELIVVNDGSQDDTAQLLAPMRALGVVVANHCTNRGKGAAVRTGVDLATGTHLIVLDADLEYFPTDIPMLVAPVLSGIADHVFGSRVFGVNTRFQSYRFAMGGRLTTLAANLLYDSCLTDLHTCLKLLPVSDFKSLELTEDGFGLDTELTARLLRAGIRPYEVPITYNGRSVAEGKKISWRDGVRCVAVLAKVRIERRPQVISGSIDTGRATLAAVPDAAQGHLFRIVPLEQPVDHDHQEVLIGARRAPGSDDNIAVGL